MIVVLCGYMGSGKTLIGNKLAKKWSYTFIDLDEKIEQKENLKISDIFKNKGEIYFRKAEMETLSEVLKTNKNLVLALGGGTPCYGNNLNLIKENKNTSLFYLKASIDTLTNRLVEQRPNRPLISNIKTEEELNDYIRKHLFERQYYYFQANYKIDVNGKAPDTICEEIEASLKD